MSNVLVVDDEDRVRALLRRSLVNEGHTVVEAADGEAALAALARAEVDLVLLDLMMPRLNGVQVMERMRERGDTNAVIVLSAVTEVAARVQAFDNGAVDFVGKPFHTAELVARVRHHLAADVPHAPPASTRFLDAGGVRLDLERRRAEVDGRQVALSEREFALLAHLMRRRGSVCTRDELLHDIWQLQTDSGSNVVEVCVRRLRKRLASAPIETVRGVGYCFYGI